MKIFFDQKCIEDNELFINYTEKNYFSGDFINGFCWLFQNKILFWEDVYFQLMASMRKMRMDIPLSFTPEMFENQIKILARELQFSQGRLKLTIFRNAKQKTPSYIIEFLSYKNFFINTENEIYVYKEISIFPNLLSTISIFQPINAIAAQYAQENDLQDVILLNNEKRIARSIFGNIFLIQDNVIYSNPLTEGSLISVLKKNFILFLRKKTNYVYKEEPLSPFLTQSAEEFFILSDERGIIPITKSRKTLFKKDIISSLTKKFIGYALGEHRI